MKTAAYIILALLVGLLAGNFSIKGDLRKAKEEIASLQGQLKSQGRRQGNFQNVASMLRMPAPPPAIPKRPAKHFGPGRDADMEVDELPPERRDLKAEKKSFEDQLQKALELWKTRSDLARNNFINNTGANPQQTQAFDAAVQQMNDELSKKIKDWAEKLKDPSAGSPEMGLRMMHDLGYSLISAYDDLDRTQPADWRGKAGEKFQMFDFINPEVARPLADVKDVFEGMRRKK
jgi:hypothetical protein